MVEISISSLCLLAVTFAGIRTSESGRIRSPKSDLEPTSGRTMSRLSEDEVFSDAKITPRIEEEVRRNQKRAAGRRNMQITEMENSTLLNVPAFTFPNSHGDTIIVAPVAYVRKDRRNRNVLSYDTSSIRTSDVTLRLRTAKIYVNVEHRPVVTKRHQSRSGKGRPIVQRRDVMINPIMVHEAIGGERPKIMARGRYWLEYVPVTGINRSGRTRTNTRIVRYVFDVTKGGLTDSNDATEDNATDQREGGDLPTLSSWRLPNVQMGLLCRRRRTRALVKCRKNGVHVYGAPYLELTTAHVDGGNYGIRWK